MCFSATSSFAASGMLASIGMLALLSVKRPSAYPRALIPCVFALQQAAEGIIWVTHGTVHTTLLQGATLFFLICATIVWPIWVPFSLLIAERDRRAAGILGALMCVGIGFGVYAARILYQFPVDVRVLCHSIAYVYGNTGLYTQYLLMVLYICVVVLPFFISTVWLTTSMGVLISGGLLIAWWSFYATLGSVWCFFAALISSLILLQLKLER